jgi:hypothetical protein
MHGKFYFGLLGFKVVRKSGYNEFVKYDEQDKKIGKGTRAWGYNWATLSLRDINAGTWSSRSGVERKADLAL